MFRILLAEYGLCGRDAPVYSKASVKNTYATIRFGMVELITFILKYCSFAQYRKTMCKPFRDEELPVVVLGQFNGNVLPVRGRAFAYIYGNVQYFSFHTSHQFCLCVWRTLKVQPPHYAIRRHAFVVLYKFHVSDFFFKLPFEKLSKKYPRASLKMRGSMITTPSISVFITSMILYFVSC